MITTKIKFNFTNKCTILGFFISYSRRCRSLFDSWTFNASSDSYSFSFVNFKVFRRSDSSFSFWKIYSFNSRIFDLRFVICPSLLASSEFNN